MPSVDIGLTITGVNNSFGALRSASDDVKHLGENAQATANRLKAIQVVIAGILIEKTLEWGKAMITAAAASQNLELRLEAFAGGAVAAHKVWDDLASSFSATPFKMDTITAAWIKMRDVMSSNTQATTVIKSIVNDVAAMGGSDENITNLAAAFQRMFAAGTSSSREFKTILQQTGLTLGDLANAAGEKGTEFARKLHQGFLTAQQFVDDFVKASNDRFGFFASNLQGSIGGAVSLITNTISKGITDIGSRTNLDEHLTVFFQNLAGAIDKVMASISQKDIDHFFDWLRDIEPFVQNVAISLVNLGQAIVTIGGIVATLLSKMPQEAIEYGMIGFFLLGKKGAALGAIMGSLLHNQIGMDTTVAPKVDSGGLVGWLKQQDMNAQAWFNRNGLNWLNSSLDNAVKANAGKTGPKDFMGMIFGQDWNKPGKNPFSDLFGNQAQMDAASKKLKDLIDSFKGQNGASSGPSYQLADALDAANRVGDQLNGTLNTTKDRIAELNFQTGGDQLGAAMEKLRVQGDGFQKTIDQAIEKEGSLKIHTAANLALVAALRGEKEKINAAIDAAIQKEQQLFSLQQQEFLSQQSLEQMKNAFAGFQLGITSNQGALFNALLGTNGGQSILSFLNQQEQYNEQIKSQEAQILSLDVQIAQVAGDPAKVAALQATLKSVQQLQDATRQALAALTPEAELQKQLWKDVGQAISTDISDGIVGLIQGTTTLGDVARKVFADMISMAIKYLVQLLEIKAISALGLFGSGGVMPGGVSLFANGGTMEPGGNVKAFANGDIITGPTLFGLAGEAGDEAIMPLTRIGGKLGVRAAGGGGGNQYHLYISAIDTQTGLQFVGQHIDAIDNQLEHRRRLNRSARK